MSVFTAARSVKDGLFKGGKSLVFDVKNGGVGIGKVSPEVPAALVAKVKQVQAKCSPSQVRSGGWEE